MKPKHTKTESPTEWRKRQHDAFEQDMKLAEVTMDIAEKALDRAASRFGSLRKVKG